MAERGTGGGKAEGRKPSEFIARLVKDPNNPPDVVEVTGFIGAAAEQGRTRIYLDTTLRNYVEVMEDAILHVEPVPDNQLGLSCIFLAASAEIFMPEAAPRAEARNVFGGAVYGDYLNAAGGGVPGIAGGVTPAPPSLGICQSLTVICQSYTPACQSIIGPCVTHRAICYTQNYFPICRTLVGIFCRSLQFLCTHQPPCRTWNVVQCTVHPLICVGVEIPTEIVPGPGPYAGMAGLEQQAAAPYAAQAGMQAHAAMGPQAAAAAVPATYVAQICISRQPYLCPVTVRDPACLLHTYNQPHCFLTVHHWQCPPVTRPSICVTCNLIQCQGPSRFSPFCGVSGNAYCGGTVIDPGGPVAGGGVPGMAGYDPYAGY